MQDFTTINNPRFLYLAELHHPFPDWAASLPVPVSSDFEKYAAVAFADPDGRMLPIATKEAAFYSAINIFAQMGDYSDACFDRVKKACAYFEIESEVAPYAILFSDVHEKSAAVAEPEGRFAIDTELNGKRFQLCPLNDAEDVRQSARELSKMASDGRIHILQFVPAAREIVKAAVDHGDVNLPHAINRVGHRRFHDFEKSASMVKNRASLMRNTKSPEDIAAAQSNYDSLVKRAFDGDVTPEDCWQGIAAIDETIELQPKFQKSARVPLAVEVVFNGALVSAAEKAASENVLINDVLVPLPEIKRINAMDAAFKLTKESADQFEKLASTDDARDLSLAVEEWPDNDRRTLLRMASELPNLPH